MTSETEGEAGRGGLALDETDHNPIFEALVTSESEVAGLVAYSLYKQNKRSWLEDFKRQVGRLPNEAETRAYIIGESTERRLATYRQLAETTLGGGAAPAHNGKGSGVASALWVLIALIVAGFVVYGLRLAGVIAMK